MPGSAARAESIHSALGPPPDAPPRVAPLHSREWNRPAPRATPDQTHTASDKDSCQYDQEGCCPPYSKAPAPPASPQSLHWRAGGGGAARAAPPPPPGP